MWKGWNGVALHCNINDFMLTGSELAILHESAGAQRRMGMGHK